MKNKAERKDILIHSFIAANPHAQSDFTVYWSAGILEGSVTLFLHVGRYSDEECVKEKWDLRLAGTGVKWKYDAFIFC